MGKRKNKSKKYRSRIKKEVEELKEKDLTKKNKIEKNTLEEKVISKDVLRKKEAEIEKERLNLIALNKSEEKKQVKESIQEKEEKLRQLLLERRELKKQLDKIREDNKILKGNVIDTKEVSSVMLNTTKEPEFLENRNKDINIFKVFVDSIKYYLSKYVFRKNIEHLEYVKTARHDLRFKILFSIFITVVTVSMLVLFMKYFSTSKDSYGDFVSNNVVTTQSSVVANNTSQENTISSLTELANKEEKDANTAYNPGISFPVVRDIKVLEKINTYQMPSWDSKSDPIEKDTTLKVNSVLFPGGYMMYQISEGQLAGKYITANPRLVEIIANNDSINFDFISYPLVVTPIMDQDVFEDKELTRIKSKVEQNKKYNVKGYGVANNRLVYHLEDGTYLPFNSNVIQN